ncbi:hypothetical protein PG985_002497 [Apiospora marii]|uniref:uncharacterized protein n=1 Tax=Apiospora marii TaxID=335849 RepID=UPI003131B069
MRLAGHSRYTASYSPARLLLNYAPGRGPDDPGVRRTWIWAGHSRSAVSDIRTLVSATCRVAVLPSTMAASVVSSVISREWGIFSASAYSEDYRTGPKLWDGAEYKLFLNQATQTPSLQGSPEAADPS